MKLKITANMVTLMRIVLMPIPGILLYGDESQLLAALVAVTILGLTDWLDGIMARRYGASVLGGLLDPIADKIFIAVIYLPLTERGIIPVAVTAGILARDFLVTALRTSMMLRDAPMRTSMVAKYKTALQMLGIGYVVLFLVFMSNPDSLWVWATISVPIIGPLCLIFYRLINGKPQGARSAFLVALMIVVGSLRYFLGPDKTIQITLWATALFTVYSGFSYLVDAWGALKGSTGRAKEWLRFFLDGLLVPLVFVFLLGRYDTFGMSGAIILIIALELGVGGLGNLLASQKITPKFRWMALKSVSQVLLAGTALMLSVLEVDAGPLAPICIVGALAVTVAYSAVSFWKHRTTYMSAI
jgi:cardiolipin synthase (CMP-forming)